MRAASSRSSRSCALPRSRPSLSTMPSLWVKSRRSKPAASSGLVATRGRPPAISVCDVRLEACAARSLWSSSLLTELCSKEGLSGALPPKIPTSSEPPRCSAEPARACKAPSRNRFALCRRTRPASLATLRPRPPVSLRSPSVTGAAPDTSMREPARVMSAPAPISVRSSTDPPECTLPCVSPRASVSVWATPLTSMRAASPRKRLPCGPWLSNDWGGLVSKVAVTSPPRATRLPSMARRLRPVRPMDAPGSTSMRAPWPMRRSPVSVAWFSAVRLMSTPSRCNGSCTPMLPMPVSGVPVAWRRKSAFSLRLASTGATVVLSATARFSSALRL